MLTQQPQNNSHTFHVMNSTCTQVDKGNCDKVKNSGIFGRAAKIAYNIVTFIPRKTWAGIKFIYDKHQKSVHNRKICAMRDKNAAYLERARADFRSKVPVTLLEYQKLPQYNYGIVNTDLLLRAGDAKGKNFSSKVLGSNPGRMKKAIAEADKKTEVSEHTKREIQLRKKYETLACELRELKVQKQNLGLEIIMITEKLDAIDFYEYKAATKTEELMRIHEVKKDKMKDLEDEIESKNDALTNALEDCYRHIGIHISG